MEPGKVLLPLAKLLAITKTLPKTADLNFRSIDNGGANLTFERAAFKLLGPDAGQYPELPEVKASSITIPANAFRSMIESTIYAITQEESRYALSGAKVEINKEGMRMVTTDGHRLALIDSKEVTAAETLELLIPKLAEYHLMSGTREDRSELAAHQPRTQNANSHAALPRLSLPASALHVLPCSVSYALHVLLSLTQARSDFTSRELGRRACSCSTYRDIARNGGSEHRRTMLVNRRRNARNSQ